MRLFKCLPLILPLSAYAADDLSFSGNPSAFMSIWLLRISIAVSVFLPVVFLGELLLSKRGMRFTVFVLKVLFIFFIFFIFFFLLWVAGI